MSIQLGSAYGKVSLDVNGLVAAVRTGKMNLQQLAAVGEQVGMALQNAGRMMTLGMTLPILATGAAAIKAASDYEETRNKAIVVFGDMADSIIENSNRAATTLGVSKQQYLDYASSIGAALTAGGMGVEESTKLAEQAVKNFADLASFHNAEVADVAVAWQSAIRGQYEPIQRYFPFITDSYLKTYGVANGMIDANTNTLTANQRAIILNAIALDGQLNPALNDFAETSDGLANSTRIMQAQLKDALIMLGTNLLPIALQVVQGLNKMLTAFNNMPPGMQKAVIAFAAFLAVLGPVLSFIGTIVSLVSGIAGLVSTLSGLGITFAGVGTAITAAGTALAGFASAALAVLGPILLIIGAIALLYWAFSTNFMGIRTTAEQLWFILKHYFNMGWQALLQVSQQRAQQLWSFFKMLVQRIRDTIKNINWQEVGRWIVFGLSNGMLGGIPLILSSATRIAKTVLETLKKTLDSRSPSRKTAVEGLNAAQGFMKGVDAGMDARTLTRTFSRPITAAAQSTNQNVSMNFANGVTIRQVQQMLALNNEQLIRKLNTALGGA
jgi:hypothetical protein